MRIQKWNKEEDNILRENYTKCTKKELIKLLPIRTWTAIKLHAKKFGLKFNSGTHSYVEGKVKVLLEDSPIAFYWMGFLAADGHFSRKSRIALTLSRKDTNHMIKFAKFISCINYRKQIRYGFGKNHKIIRIAIQDKFLIPKIVEKFNLKSNKTYNPPDIAWMSKSENLLIAFIIGFIDGDGSIVYQSGRKDCSLKLKNHKSWLKVLQFISNQLGFYTKTKIMLARINSKGYAKVNFSNRKVLRYLKNKTKELYLPVLDRKWNRVDEFTLSRYEKARINEEKVKNLFLSGKKQCDIVDMLGLSIGAVSIIIKRLGLR